MTLSCNKSDPKMTNYTENFNRNAWDKINNENVELKSYEKWQNTIMFNL